MKCPYSDIGCHYICDVTHNCEAENMGMKKSAVCPHEPQNIAKNERKEASNGSDDD